MDVGELMKHTKCSCPNHDCKDESEYSTGMCYWCIEEYIEQKVYDTHQIAVRVNPKG